MKLFINEKPLFNDLPWLTDEAIAFLEGYFEHNKHVTLLEFGTGSSTLWFSRHAEKVISVEHDQRWYNHVEQELKNRSIQNVEYHLLQKNYYTFCDTLPAASIDFVLVDGKDRLACVERAMRILKPGGILMLDNAERPNYKPIYDLLKEWTFFATTQHGKSRLGFEQEGWQTNWWQKPLA